MSHSMSNVPGTLFHLFLLTHKPEYYYCLHFTGEETKV